MAIEIHLVTVLEARQDFAKKLDTEKVKEGPERDTIWCLNSMKTLQGIVAKIQRSKDGVVGRHLVADRQNPTRDAIVTEGKVLITIESAKTADELVQGAGTDATEAAAEAVIETEDDLLQLIKKLCLYLKLLIRVTGW